MNLHPTRAAPTRQRAFHEITEEITTMTRKGTLRFGLLAASLALAASSTFGQDPAKIDASIYKCTLENERMRLCEVVFKPGAKIALHSHPDRVVYVVGGGTLAVTGADGKAKDYVYEPGQGFWFNASSHAAVNNGKTEVKLVMVELKQPAKK
jgi:quercetin dioxygenase-like cupin family protein